MKTKEILCRGVLAFNSIGLITTGYYYLTNSQPMSFLLKETNLESALLAKFLGITYIQIALISIYSIILWDNIKVSDLLIIIGIVYHFGFATLRPNLQDKFLNLYKERPTMFNPDVQRGNIISGILMIGAGIYGKLK